MAVTAALCRAQSANARENKIYCEWLVRDNIGLLVQLPVKPHAFATNMALKQFEMSIGVQSGPPIGVQKGPPPGGWRTSMICTSFTLLAA